MKKPLCKLNFKLLSTALLVLLVSGKSIAQNTGSSLKNLKILNDSLNPNVQISFDTQRQVDNLLLLIIDKSGNTIFLENKYRFKGSYNGNIDLSKNDKGNFTLIIISDEEKIKKNLTIK